MVWFILGIAVLGLATWWLLRRGTGVGTPAPAASRSTAGGHPPGPAIWGKQFVIPAGAEACPVARGLEGKCFTLAKTPSIPLAGCTHANCHCRYEPLADRRNHLERRSGQERRPTLRFEPGKSDRRNGSDRREENFNPFAKERD
jgi:hypothetical protein